MSEEKADAGQESATEIGRPTTATFVVSAGRCGTQWLATTLAEHYGDRALVTHEPLKFQYRPKSLLRSRARLRDLPNFPVMERHLRRVDAALRGKDYIETGWPAFAAIPRFYRLVGERLKIVHLTRHPVYSACSMVTHEYYQAARRDGFAAYALLDPSDPGIRFKEYRERWAGMTPYEKCLFHWAEIHAYAFELCGAFAGRVPWLRTSMEELFDPESGAFARLVSFLDLPAREGPLAQMRERVDDWHKQTELPLDWRRIFDHPVTLRLSAMMDYDVEAVSQDRIEQRYRRGIA
jgi:hypothetical protein